MSAASTLTNSISTFRRLNLFNTNTNLKKIIKKVFQYILANSEACSANQLPYFSVAFVHCLNTLKVLQRHRLKCIDLPRNEYDGVFTCTVS